MESSQPLYLFADITASVNDIHLAPGGTFSSKDFVFGDDPYQRAESELFFNLYTSPSDAWAVWPCQLFEVEVVEKFRDSRTDRLPVPGDFVAPVTWPLLARSVKVIQESIVPPHALFGPNGAAVEEFLGNLPLPLEQNLALFSYVQEQISAGGPDKDASIWGVGVDGLRRASREGRGSGRLNSCLSASGAVTRATAGIEQYASAALRKATEAIVLADLLTDTEKEAIFRPLVAAGIPVPQI